MILLQKNSLDIADRFQVESMSLQLSERQSTATITVGPAAPELTTGDWLMDDTEPGKGIIWRVRIVDTSYERRTRTITLEHISATLKDMVMFGETTAKKMSGSTNCPARKAVEYILGKSPHWELGTFGYDSVSNPYSFNGDDLYNALQTVSSSLDDPWWSYDLSVYPFKLNINKRSETVTNEMRMTRNIQTARMTIDKSRMYTRIYPIGKNNMHINGEYISQNEDVYGVICKVQTDQSKETESELRRWALERLNRHCVPSITMSVNGIDLSEETGEDLDHITLGALCQVPLPGYGTTVTATVTKLSWSDKIKEPKRLTVTLANNEEDIASIVNHLTETSSSTSGSGAGGRGGAKKAQEDHAWFTDTEDHVAMTAEAIIGKDPSGKVNWSKVANITVNGNGIYSTVTETKGDMVVAKSQIKQLQDTIDMTVRAVGENGEITAASIVMAVNRSGSSVVISADHIQLNGNVSLSDAMTATGIGVNFKKSVNLLGNNGIAIPAGGYISLGSYSIRLETLQGMIKSASSNGNVLTLTPFYGDPINFSKATTLSGKWSSGTYTVTAKQNNETVNTNTAQIKQLTQNGSVSVIGKNVGQNVHVYATENGGSNSVSTGFSQEVWIDATEVFNNGKAEGAGQYSLFGYFDKYGTVTVEGQTYTAYITQSTSANASHLALYRK